MVPKKLYRNTLSLKVVEVVEPVVLLMLADFFEQVQSCIACLLSESVVLVSTDNTTHLSKTLSGFNTFWDM